MTKQITQQEFETLAAEHSIVTEKDVEYWYDCVVDAEGNELAFATYRSGDEPIYQLREA